MPTGTVEAIEHSAHKSNEWVEDFTRELDGADEALAWRVLRRHVSPGEIDDVLAQLPKEIREVLEGA